MTEAPQYAYQYRVFVNAGKDGCEDIIDFDSLSSLAYFHLVKREADAVTFRILALKTNDKRIDGIEPEIEENATTA